MVKDKIGQSNVKDVVKERYGKIAKGSCGCSGGGCCGSSAPKAISKAVGYSDEEMAAVPEGANLGLGCGNPTAIAGLKAGETVLDLGSGAGFDAFLAADKVGQSGKVIGVDMTPEMLSKARANAVKGGYKNVEFRRGDIENLPVDIGTVDVIISNCVVNLSPDKPQVFREAHRVLKTGGRLCVSDIVLERELPEAIRDSAAAYAACIGGAILKKDYLKAIKDAGFKDIKITSQAIYEIDLTAVDPAILKEVRASGMTDEELEETACSVKSIAVQAVKS